MMNDLNIYGRISDLFYKDMLGLADEEEKRELDSLLVTYKLKGLDREKIIARLQEQEVFDGKEAYREFRALKQLGGRNRRLIWWTSIAAQLSCWLLPVGGSGGSRSPRAEMYRSWLRRSSQDRAGLWLRWRMGNKLFWNRLIVK